MYKLFTLSFGIYLVVNLFENMVHYNIGKYTDRPTRLDVPTRKDWPKIVGVMLVFALLQGSLTCFLYNRCS